MIIRAFRYRVVPGCREAFEAATRGEGAARAAATPGVRFAFAGRSREDPDRGIVVTGWADFASVDALVRSDLFRPTFLSPGAAASIAEHEVTHWEALDLPETGSGDATVLRVMTATVQASRDASYFAYVRERVWPRLDEVPGLAHAWVGRQVDGGPEERVLAVSAWASLDALAVTGGDRAPLYDDHVDVGFAFDRVELFDLFASHVRSAAGAAPGPTQG